MRRVVVCALMVLACSSSGPKPSDALDGPVGFRVLSETENQTPCNEAPDYEVATNEDRWIDVFDQQTSCQAQETIDLPDVDFSREIAVAVWWKTVGCLGFTVHTGSVDRVRGVIEVRARSTGPTGACATAVGQLESFLALPRSERLTGREPIRFVLDGKAIGTAKPSASP